MKILVVAPYYLPHVGGIEKHLHTILCGLKQQFEHEIVVVTSNHEGNSYMEDVVDGIKVYRLPMLRKVSNTPVGLRWKEILKGLLLKEHPDLINGRGPPPYISDVACSLAKELNIPFVLGWHFPSMRKGNLLLDTIIVGYESTFFQRMIRDSKKIICSSEYIKEDFLSKVKEKTTVITQGIDSNLFRKLDIKKVPQSICFIGNLETRVKGLEYLLSAVGMLVKRFPKIVVNVIGPGVLDMYKKQVQTLGISNNVVFHGPVTGQPLVNELNANEIFVCPSTSENFPSTILEASSCELPVIASAIGSIPFYIKDKVNGLLVKPRNSRELASAIAFLFDNKGEADRIAKAGFDSVQNKFNWNDRIIKTNEVFMEALHS